MDSNNTKDESDKGANYIGIQILVGVIVAIITSGITYVLASTKSLASRYLNDKQLHELSNRVTKDDNFYNYIFEKLKTDKRFLARNDKDGKDGENGKDGRNGENGKDGRNGENGKDGKDGENGKDGRNGESAVFPNNTILAFNLYRCPEGWTEYTLAYGRFIRGIDRSDLNIDPDGERPPGNIQEDQFKEHNHKHKSPRDYESGGGSGHTRAKADATGETSGEGGEETRPKNVALLYCEKEVQ